MIVTKAADAWRLLNGVLCIYKPVEFSMNQVRRVLCKRICNDLNEMVLDPPKTYLRPILKENPMTLELQVVDHIPQPDYSEHPLVAGPHYQPIDIEFEAVQELDMYTSGLCLIGINDGCSLARKIRDARLLTTYSVHGRLGRATLDQTIRSKIVERTTYDHVTLGRLERILRRFAARFQRLAFQSAGVHIQSQEAAVLASKGLVRPREDSFAIFYDLKCSAFKRPNFTLDVRCINENEQALYSLVHEIGLDLRSTAVCTGIRKMRHGRFSVTDALLLKHCNLQNILENILLCQKIISESSLEPSPSLLRAPASHDHLLIDAMESIAADDAGQVDDADCEAVIRHDSLDDTDVEDAQEVSDSEYMSMTLPSVTESLQY